MSYPPPPPAPGQQYVGQAAAMPPPPGPPQYGGQQFQQPAGAAHNPGPQAPGAGSPPPAQQPPAGTMPPPPSGGATSPPQPMPSVVPLPSNSVGPGSMPPPPGGIAGPATPVQPPGAYGHHAPPTSAGSMLGSPSMPPPPPAGGAPGTQPSNFQRHTDPAAPPPPAAQTGGAGTAPPPPAAFGQQPPPPQQQQYQSQQQPLPPPPGPQSDPTTQRQPSPPAYYGAPPPTGQFQPPAGQPQQYQQQYQQQQQAPPPPQGQHSMPPPPPQQGHPQQQQQQQPGPPPPPQTGYPQQQHQQQGPPPPAQQQPQQGGQQMPLPQATQSGAYRQHQQHVDEQPRPHFVTLTRASSSTSRIMNHESMPRPKLEDRVAAATGVTPSPSAPHIIPASTDYVRLTTPVVPSTPQLADKFALPMAYCITPLGNGTGGAPKVPCVNFADLPSGGCTIVRCRRCRAYVNPYCHFLDAGRRWQCAICRGLNDVPAPYYSTIDPTRNLRTDIDKRPELCHAVCDFIAPADYLVRAPQRPTYLFLLDLSYNAAEFGMIEAVCTGILDGLWKLKNAAEESPENEDASERFESMQVGFVGFDAVVYLFNLRSGLSTPAMIVAPDLATDTAPIIEKTGMQESLELPCLLEDLVVSLKDSFDLVVSLLEKLPSMFANNKNAEAAYGPAVQTAITLLNPTGGKIVSALASCPSVGEGRLKNREDPKLFHHAKEHSMTLPATEWYKERALACSHAHISVDLIVAAPNPIDVASVAPLPRYTGGHVVHATSANKAALHRDVVRSVTRTLGFEAVFRIRNPPQLGTINFFGHFYVRGNDMLALPVADEDACYAIQFNLQTSLSGPLHVQTALLYTNHARERRIRVFTFPVESSQSLARVFNKADAHTMASIMFKTAIDHSVTNSFQACVANMNDRFVKSLRTFKAMVSGAGGRTTGTLVLPDALRLLPAYLNGYQRMPATRFCSVIDTAPDARVTNMCLLAHANPDCAVAYCTPSIHCVYSNRGDLDKLPRQEIVSIEAMKHDSVYLVELPGSLRCLWYGRSVETKALEAFGIPSVAPSDARGSGVATEDEEAAIDSCVARFRDLVARLDRLSCGLPHTPLHFVAQGSSGAAAGSPNNSFAQGTLTSPSRISQGPGNAATAGSPKTPGGSSFGVKVVTERTLLTRMLEEEAKEAVSFTSYLAFLMRRSNTAE